MSFTTPTDGRLGASGSVLQWMTLGSATGSSGTTTLQVSVSDTGTGQEASLSLSAGLTAADRSFRSETISTAASGTTPISGLDQATGTDNGTVLDITPACDATSGSLGTVTRRLGPEYFLPHWVTANSDRSGVLYGICQWGAERGVQWRTQTQRAVAGKYLTLATSLEPLYEWQVNFVPPTDQEMTVTFTAVTVSGTTQGTARRATSQFDYDTAVEPVWYQDSNSRVIRLRGLFMHTIQRNSSGAVYTICGSGTNSYLGVVLDTGYFYRRTPTNVWEWVSPESDRFAANQVTLPDSGTWLISFGSIVDLTNLQVTGSCTFSWSGGQSVPLPLIFSPVSNLFDGYGYLFGLPRLVSPLVESNFSYKGRLLSYIQAVPDATIAGVIRGIGSRFGLVSKLLWDGVSPVTLDIDGSQDYTALKVVEFNQFYEIDEQLPPVSGNTAFYSTYKDWRQNAIVFVNGLPTTSYSVSGNQILFSQPVTGSVEAIYSIQTYTPVANGAGAILGINPGQGVVSGNYTVLLTRMVNAHTVDDPDYQKTTLLDAAGLPNALFTEIAGRLTENNPTTFGRARWGGNANWFDETDTVPAISRLPIPFDTET